MGHTAPPPTEATIKKAHEWNERICHMLSSVPPELNKGEMSHGEIHDEDSDWDTYPVWGFTYTHDTLPARELSIIWGVPKHSGDCECIEGPRTKLMIAVLDTDIDEPIPDSAEIRIKDPGNIEFLTAVVGVAVTMFGMKGTI